MQITLASPDSAGSTSSKKLWLKELVKLEWVCRSGSLYGLLPAGRTQIQSVVQPPNQNVIPMAQAA